MKIMWNTHFSFHKLKFHWNIAILVGLLMLALGEGLSDRLIYAFKAQRVKHNQQILKKSFKE